MTTAGVTASTIVAYEWVAGPSVRAIAPASRAATTGAGLVAFALGDAV